VSATIFGGGGVERERAPATRAESARAAAPAGRADAVTVAGRLTLLGATGREGGRVTDAVVYLEPIAPEPAPAAPRPVAVAPARPVAEAPRDSMRLLWSATRELGVAVGELRDGFARLYAAVAGGRAPSAADSAPAAPLNAVAALADAPRPAPPRPVAEPRPAPPPLPTAVPTRAGMVMQGKEFRPHVRVVPSGSAVEWPNRDPFSHNVFSNTPGGAFDLGLYPRGESRDAAFRRPGVYEIFCNIHPRMSAFVVSVPTPFYVQPNDDGSFTVPGVPPGRYRLRAWHERAREVTQVVTIDGGGARDVRLTLDARGYRAVPHLNKFGQRYQTSGRDEY
jgi:plastocyanin